VRGCQETAEGTSSTHDFMMIHHRHHHATYGSLTDDAAERILLEDLVGHGREDLGPPPLLVPQARVPHLRDRHPLVLHTDNHRLTPTKADGGPITVNIVAFSP
jgi:hypothetical protein